MSVIRPNPSYIPQKTQLMYVIISVYYISVCDTTHTLSMGRITDTMGVLK